jgi:phage terminase small subunit
MKLNPRQAKFAAEYAVDGNALRAAVTAGYSPKTAYSIGSRLTKHVEVQAAIQRALAARCKRTEITADYVLTGLRDVAEFCRKPQPRLNRAGEIIGEVIDSTGANRAFELLGKNQKLFTDNLNIGGELSESLAAVAKAILAKREKGE